MLALLEKLKQEWHVIRAAPWSFSIVCLVVIVACWSGFHYAYQEKLADSDRRATQWKGDADYWKEIANRKPTSQEADVKPSQPDLNQLLGGRYNSMLEHRHLAARLRHRVPPSASTIALDAMLRRDSFEPRARVELFAELATYFKSLVEFPPEATEQLSDEQYVRNVAEILFAKRG